MGNLNKLPDEQPLATPDLEDTLSGQEMNHMPECLRAPAQAIRRNWIPPRKILVTGTFSGLMSSGKLTTRRKLPEKRCFLSPDKTP